MEPINQLDALELQRHQYEEKLPLYAIVPAGQEYTAKVDVTNLGMFRCMFLTGRYSTLAKNPTTPTQAQDTGVSYLKMTVTDGGTQRKLFSDYVPLENILSPGRMKCAKTSVNGAPILNPGVVTDAPAPQLFYPFRMAYDFAASTSILVSFKNSSDVDQIVDLTFHGIRVLTSAQ